MGGMMLEMANRSTCRNTCPGVLCRPQITHGLPYHRIRPLQWAASD